MEQKRETSPDLAWLHNPQVFQVGRLAPHTWPHYNFGQNRRNLNGKWQLGYFPTPGQALDAFLCGDNRPEHAVRVPGHLQLQGFGQPQYVNTMYPWDGLADIAPPDIPLDNPTALYRREIFLSPQETEGFVSLCFHGVESSVMLWVNGRFAGYAEDSFTPSEFEISALVRPGGNSICALVPRYSSGSWLEDQDFWRFSGIFRDVELITAPTTHIRDIDTRQDISDDYTSATLAVEVALTGAGSVTARLYGHNGEPLSRETLAVTGGLAHGTLGVSSPALWNAENPMLYTLELNLFSPEGALLQSCTLDIGFRRIEIVDAQVRLNGARLILRGVNRHEFGHLAGRAITEESILADILLLKRNNFNAVRTSHYPNQACFYHLCDRYGLYVIDETNLETHGTWMVQGKVVRGEKILPGDKPEWREAVLDRATSMYERDKNHACVISWSCGNESYGGSSLNSMASYFRGKADGRFVHYEGIFHDRTFETTSDVESQMYTPAAEVERYLRDTPKKPFLMCEYAHAMGNSFGGVQLYTALEAYPQYLGGFIWDWCDQMLARKPGGPAYTGLVFQKPTDGYFCANGLLFADHSPTPKLQEAKSLYAPLHIVCEADGVTIANRHAFFSTKAYVFAWRLLCEGSPVQSGSFQLDVGPGQSATQSLEFLMPPEGECVLECAALLGEDTSWARAGHEVAFGQAVLRPFRCEAPQQPALLIPGDCNTGASLGRGFALVSATTGALSSLLTGSRELFTDDLRPMFWRAPTDNDIGAAMADQWSSWKTASLYQRLLGYAVLTPEAQVTATLALAGRKEPCRLEYRFLEPDTIQVTLRMDVRADMPCFGLTFALSKVYNRLHWYGNIQPEAYSDRQNGARLGIGSSTVEAEYVPYANPQECANKTMLRWLTVTDAEGHGLRIFGPEAFEASVLPYTAHELESAYHLDALPPHTQNVVRIMKKQCGVGGDDSWGAHAHLQYRCAMEGETEFIFYLQTI